MNKKKTANNCRYALFGGENYYADGGAGDFIGWFTSVKDAKLYADKNRAKFTRDGIEFGIDCWAHVAECKFMKILCHANISDPINKIKWRKH